MRSRRESSNTSALRKVKNLRVSSNAYLYFQVLNESGAVDVAATAYSWHMQYGGASSIGTQTDSSDSTIRLTHGTTVIDADLAPIDLDIRFLNPDQFREPALWRWEGGARTTASVKTHCQGSAECKITEARNIEGVKISCSAGIFESGIGVSEGAVVEMWVFVKSSHREV